MFRKMALLLCFFFPSLEIMMLINQSMSRIDGVKHLNSGPLFDQLKSQGVSTSHLNHAIGASSYKNQNIDI